MSSALAADVKKVGEGDFHSVQLSGLVARAHHAQDGGDVH